jgi:SEC-C motif-containing protein
MRSRYSAYVKHAIDYVERTHDRKSREQFDRAAAKAWSENTDWKGLEIRATERGLESDDEGTVEFIARYRTAVEGIEPQDVAHHEVSHFRRESGAWVYVDGKIVRAPVTRSTPKLGRNDPCHCGSGKKFKKCCG